MDYDRSRSFYFQVDADTLDEAIRLIAADPVKYLSGGPKRWTHVDRELLESCIGQLEKRRDFRTRTDLYTEVAALYNRRRDSRFPAISYTIVRLRIRRWDIPVKTPPAKIRGRKPK